MKVCLDIQSAIAQRAGVGRYTHKLAEHLPAGAGDDDIALFYFDFTRKGIPFPVDGATQKAVRWCPGRLAQQAWKRLNAPPFDWFSGPADVFHFPNFIRPPLSRGKSVITIHDMSFLRLPETTEAKNLAYMSRKIRPSVEQADAIITNSEFSKRETQEFLGVSGDNIFPIPLGIHRPARPPSESEITLMTQMLRIERPYLLTVGTLEPRKNIPFLIEVFEQLRDFDGDLVIAGMLGWKFEPILERIRSSSAAFRIRHVRFVDDSLLPALYAGAEVFLFPSLYEGFGFPPLEAMAVGTPVVSSAAGALPETLGDAALLVSEFRTDLWTQAISKALEDSAIRQRLKETGPQHAARYTWEETARRTWDIYRKAAR